METLTPYLPYLLGIALAVTALVLFVGIFGFALSPEFSKRHSTTLMRARVVAQAVAVALFALILYTSSQ